MESGFFVSYERLKELFFILMIIVYWLILLRVHFRFREMHDDLYESGNKHRVYVKDYDLVELRHDVAVLKRRIEDYDKGIGEE